MVPTPDIGRDAAVDFVATRLGHLVDGPVAGSRRFTGGQSRADAALAAYDVTGYAATRNEVWPPERRGASALSPFIRHGLLQLPRVWRAVAGGPPRDVAKFRDELLWQEYARHWYAHHGTATAHGIRRSLAGQRGIDGWDRTMACIDATVGELEHDGWLVNQTRMWLASHWAVREGARWQEGEDRFFAHLLDGSRAANRLGWQWTTGVGSAKPYGFSRSQVEKRAPGLCAGCERRHACPIADWPDDPPYMPRPETAGGGATTDLHGPLEPVVDGEPEVVWLTAESLGDDDPALAAHPELPVVFVFDEPLLARLRLSAKRLVFLTETLAELGADRPVELHVGEPTDVLAGRRLAVTHAPVPGFARRARSLDIAARYPWPWLARPTGGSVASFSAWRRRSATLTV